MVTFFVCLYQGCGAREPELGILPGAGAQFKTEDRN